MPVDIQPKNKTLELSSEDSDRHEFIRKLAEKVRQDDDDREVWKNKQVVASNARLGIRRKTDRPWPGFREVPLPITDKLIRKMKSMYVSIATQMKNPVTVAVEEGIQQPFDTDVNRDSAKRIERALNGLIRKREFQWRKKVTIFCDYAFQNGFAFFKVFERFSSKTINRTINLSDYDAEVIKQFKAMKKDELLQEMAFREGMDLNDKEEKSELEKAVQQFKSGKKVIRFTKKEVYSEPHVAPESALNVIVPQESTEVQKCWRITNDLWMNYQEIKDRADKGIYDLDAVESLEEDSGSEDSRLITLNAARMEGISSQPKKPSLFNVRECYAWYKEEKWVFSWIENPSTKGGTKKTDNIVIIQEMKFPLEHGLWPWVKHDIELKDNRWYSSRGIAEQIRGLQQIMERVFNARIARDEVNNSPMLRIDPSIAAGLGGDEIRFKPGQGVVAAKDQVEVLNKTSSVDISGERIEQQVKALIEEYEAIPDYTIRNAVNPGGKRTLGELEMAQTASQRQLGTDVALFLETLSEVSNQMYLLLKETVTRTTVIGGVVLTPNDFLVKVNVSWRGSVEATDHLFQLQKAQQRADFLFQYASSAGLMTPENVYNTIREVLEADPDLESIDRFITKPQAIQQSEVQRQQDEIIRMKNGFDAPVKVDDKHDVHLGVIEQFIHDPANQEILKDPQFQQKLKTHATVHMQAEQQIQGMDKNKGLVKQVVSWAGQNGKAA